MHGDPATYWQPTLVGSTITLRPLTSADFERLYEAASDSAIWAQHPDRNRYRREVFRDNFFAGAITSGTAFAIVENATARIIGSTRYYDWQPTQREIAIGYTFVERRFWGRGVNDEMKALLLDHAFAHVHAVWFHVGQDNLRSRRAVEKLGAVAVREDVAALAHQQYVRLHYRLTAAARLAAGATERRA